MAAAQPAPSSRPLSREEASHTAATLRPYLDIVHGDVPTAAPRPRPPQYVAPWSSWGSSTTATPRRTSRSLIHCGGPAAPAGGGPPAMRPCSSPSSQAAVSLRPSDRLAARIVLRPHERQRVTRILVHEQWPSGRPATFYEAAAAVPQVSSVARPPWLTHSIVQDGGPAARSVVSSTAANPLCPGPSCSPRAAAAPLRAIRWPRWQQTRPHPRQQPATDTWSCPWLPAVRRPPSGCLSRGLARGGDPADP